MFAHLKDYDVMKDTKTTDEGLIIFCPFSNSDPILQEEVANDVK